ncbi:assimilatory sulfite reductase (NADPH) flavoprotein subunit [Nitrosococcus watsonii]|uniref:Sulfite reductase [NADPH] flavoprotein alpha-component n=1 Tax=Nitrosococcus watsoni (strain C-113) TaxID=105559 RepID=D8K5E5_NITWC|nr:assimilatory sulfite reductase (NADPH) flavoprotein subunit [Nitrosococcus watsonii]ADJ28122.1 sulfite reductase (NADPH) flavoprotein, alpha chain [Nitrosococcus watsonii C-113]
MGHDLFSTQNSIFTEKQAEYLNRLIPQLSPEQMTWLSGYLAGFNAAQQGAASVVQPTAAQPLTDSGTAARTATVLFGSQTGNAEKLAEKLCGQLSQAGCVPTLQDMGSYKPRQLKRENYLFVIVSTHGEGDPPDNAEAFHEFLHSKKAPKLDGLQFSVLALGDSSYEYFCKTGQDFDTRLEELGGKRFSQRADCDVDYDDAADAWMDGILQTLSERLDTPAVAAVSSTVATQAIASSYTRKNPFSATLLENLRITGRGSSKDVRHIELSLEGSQFSFEPGDSLGVVPSNCPELVAELIEVSGLDPQAIVTDGKGESSTLEDALSHGYEITTITRPFLEKYATFAESRELGRLLQEENRSQLRNFIYGREVIDVIRGFPLPGITADQFVGLLRKLPPRLYSIASSYQANPDEVHLTVAVVRYQSHGRSRKGVATTFLSERVSEDGTVPVYVDSNKNFRLPEDPNAPLIMIGPGTGVAPFRAFLEEREIIGATGKNWLFFGDRHFHTDFLYQREWLDYRKKGLLTRIDVAFSRDEEKKTYVQHRMLENSRELYAWLEEGAYFYVCGDAEYMAPDVHEALLAIVEKEGCVSREKAVEYMRDLQQGRRYQRDVY